MRIQEIRTRVVEWRGKTVALPPHFCTNPMDFLALPEASSAFWYVFEGEPRAKDGFVDRDEGTPGLGLTVNERALEKFDVVE